MAGRAAHVRGTERAALEQQILVFTWAWLWLLMRGGRFLISTGLAPCQLGFFSRKKTLKTTSCANILLWVKENTVHINIKKQDKEGERVVSQRSGYFSSRVAVGLCPVSCTTQRWQPGCGTCRRWQEAQGGYLPSAVRVRFCWLLAETCSSVTR